MHEGFGLGRGLKNGWVWSYLDRIVLEGDGGGEEWKGTIGR